MQYNQFSDTEAEQAILGAIFIKNELLSEAKAALTSDHFKEPRNKIIYQGMIALEAESSPIDEVLLGDMIRKKSEELLKKAGGYAYFAELVDLVPNSNNINYYIGVLLGKSQTEQIKEAGKKIYQSANLPERPDLITTEKHADNLLEKAEKEIEAIKEARRPKENVFKLSTLLTKKYEDLEILSEDENEITGLESGFQELDKITCGLQKQDMIVVGARPSMGKTAFALNIANHVSITSPVLFFSLEQSKEQLTERTIAAESTINGKKLKNGNLTQDDWDHAGPARVNLNERELYICDSGEQSVDSIKATAKRLNRQLLNNGQEGLKLIVVDYIHLMLGKNTKESNREQEIGRISRNLKGLAKSLNIPIIVLAQLNRALENRENKIPRMSDIRDSGSIEQDADIILFIYREVVYKPDTRNKEEAQIIIGKHRTGELKKFILHFQPEYCLFKSPYSQQDAA